MMNTDKWLECIFDAAKAAGYEGEPDPEALGCWIVDLSQQLERARGKYRLCMKSFGEVDDELANLKSMIGTPEIAKRGDASEYTIAHLYEDAGITDEEWGSGVIKEIMEEEE